MAQGLPAALISREPFHLDIEDLAPGSLRVVSFQGREAMNETYTFDVLVVAMHVDERALEETLGRPATLLVDGVELLPQHFHGVVGAVSSEGMRERSMPLYRLRIVPKLALLERRVTCRIFQDCTVAEIVDAVLQPHEVARRWDLVRPLRKRVYCVQYHESDLAFVLRMLAEEGIFFRFDHAELEPGAAQSREVLVLSDAAERVPPIAGVDRLPMRDSVGGDALRADDAHVSGFRTRHVVAATQALLRDYDFIHPRFEQRSLTEPLIRSARPDLAGRLPGMLGVYEHKMEYEEPDLEPHDAPRYLEQLRAAAHAHEGESRCARLRPGRAFALTESEPPRTDGRYTITRVEHEGRAPEVAAASDTGLYKNRFACVRAEVPFRPPRPERRLRQVTETATVVGPASEEIYADAHGRIKVQFHWDLDGQNDERSACWIRVSQPWAGPAWGFQFIPRIGMEVIVTFLGGDLDRPLITGTVYNAINTPSYPLPGEVTRSGIRSRSTPGGDGYNEMSFEDAKGGEQIRVHAERDLDEDVLHDHTTRVGNDQSIHVAHDQSTLVDHDHREDIRGNSNRRVGGTRTDTFESDALTVVEGYQGETIEGISTRQIGTADRPSSGEVYAFGDYIVGAGRSVRVRAETSIIFECGESSIELTPDAIRLRSPDVRTIATDLASMQSGSSSVIATDEIEIASKEVHIFGESSRLSLAKDATLTSDTKTVVRGGGAGLGLAGDATLAGGKVIVAGKGATLVLDDNAKLDGALVMLNCGGAGGGVSAEDCDPKGLATPREVKRKPLNVRVLDEQLRPMPDKHYVLVVQGERFEGVTKPSAEIDVEVADEATTGKLTVWSDAFPEGPRIRWSVAIEQLPPAEEPPGGRVRLSNLGYYQGPPVEVVDDRLGDAIGRFQFDQKLRVTRRLDAETVVTLVRIHGH